jgi:hypothetical protein
MWDCNNPYTYRDDNLLVLGFTSYRAYLASELWASIRARVIRRDKSKCRRCGRNKSNLQVHHRAYDPATLRGDCLDALMAVCDRCHKKAERPKDRSRSGHDRLAQASADLLKQSGRKKRERHDELPDYAPMWWRKAKGSPKQSPASGPRKRSEQRP